MTTTSNEKEEALLTTNEKEAFEDSPRMPTTQEEESKVIDLSDPKTSTPSNLSPTILESIGHFLQRWSLQNQSPLQTTFFSLFLYPILWLFSIIQGVRANQATYLYRKYRVHGPNFCCASGVWISDYKSVQTNLLEPQGRAMKLAPSSLDGAHLPHGNLEGDGRLTFLLALSQKDAGGDGSYEGFRKAFEDYITNSKGTMERLNDDVTKGIVDKMVQEYRKMGGYESRKFFKDNDVGLMDFLLKYLHYVLFGLDPNDSEVMNTLNKLHYDSMSASYYLKTFGNMLQCLKFRNWPKQMRKVAEIYENSPALQDFPENEEKYNNMTRYELANLALAIMSLAGMVGPKTFAMITLGKMKLPKYVGKETHKINVCDIWDTLDLTDREEVKKYAHECGRLRNPVSNTHKVAQEDFTVNISGVDRTFPKGTIIYIPMLLAGLDKDMWGGGQDGERSAFEFNHERENLCPFSMIFHSVGDETNGRICPGRDVAEALIVDMLIALGKERQKEGMVE